MDAVYAVLVRRHLANVVAVSEARTVDLRGA